LSRLLGGPGRYTFTPAGAWHVWGGYYEPGSLIWRSRWVGDSRIECREALAMPAGPRRAVLLRRVEAVDGPAKVTVVLDLRGGYGRGRMTDLSRPGDAWTGRSGRLRFRWSGAGRARYADGQLRMAVKLAAAHWFERNRSSCGPAALYTEEYDVHQRQLRGNLPQAFVHAGVLKCAVTLSRDVRLGTAG
jgi:hypothetical protein